MSKSFKIGYDSSLCSPHGSSTGDNFSLLNCFSSHCLLPKSYDTSTGNTISPVAFKLKISLTDSLMAVNDGSVRSNAPHRVLQVTFSYICLACPLLLWFLMSTRLTMRKHGPKMFKREHNIVKPTFSKKSFDMCVLM